MHTVAVDILTGFLGSGKTTLLRHVLDHGLRGKPVAVIMNEIGEIGIDGRVVTGLSAVEKMVELSSGCICCTIDDYRFDLAVQEIIETTRPHLIIIESTGLADPEPLVDRIKAAGLGLDAIIAVVDAEAAPRHLRETVVATRQIEAADFIVLNKLDLVDEAAAARLDRRLARLNPRAERFRTVRGAMDSDVLFATGVAAYRERSTRQGPAHLHEDGFTSFVYRSAAPLDQERFTRPAVATAPRRSAGEGHRALRRPRVAMPVQRHVRAAGADVGEAARRCRRIRRSSSVATWHATRPRCAPRWRRCEREMERRQSNG